MERLPEKKAFIPEPAESFEVEFLGSRSLEVQSAMAKIGGFKFKRSAPEENGKVIFEGGREDGTTIRIEIQKGDGYKSPKILAEENSNQKETENA